MHTVPSFARPLGPGVRGPYDRPWAPGSSTRRVLQRRGYSLADIVSGAVASCQEPAPHGLALVPCPVPARFLNR
jgi:hypothetical protein